MAAMSAALLITADVEVFGDGSGSVEACCTAPLDALLREVEAQGARLTLFPDALGLQTLERRGDPEVAALRSALAAAHGRGHDVQLHVHPQWAYGTPRVADLAEHEVLEVLSGCVDWLGQVLAPSGRPWRPLVFRAGGWAIQPSRAVVRALVTLGLRVDSSVMPGRALGGAAWFDYRCVPRARAWWRVAEDVCSHDLGALCEVPVATATIGVARDLAGIAARRARPPRAAGCTGGGRSRTLDGRRLATLGVAHLDYCTHGAWVLGHIQRSWLRTRGGPVVAMGHTKNLSPRALRQLRRWLDGCRLRPITFSKWVDGG